MTGCGIGSIRIAAVPPVVSALSLSQQTPHIKDRKPGMKSERTPCTISVGRQVASRSQRTQPPLDRTVCER